MHPASTCTGRSDNPWISLFIHKSDLSVRTKSCWIELRRRKAIGVQSVHQVYSSKTRRRVGKGMSLRAFRITYRIRIFTFVSCPQHVQGLFRMSFLFFFNHPQWREWSNLNVLTFSSEIYWCVVWIKLWQPQRYLPPTQTVYSLKCSVASMEIKTQKPSFLHRCNFLIIEKKIFSLNYLWFFHPKLDDFLSIWITSEERIRLTSRYVVIIRANKK